MAGREAVGGRRSPDSEEAGLGSAHSSSPEMSEKRLLIEKFFVLFNSYIHYCYK